MSCWFVWVKGCEFNGAVGLMGNGFPCAWAGRAVLPPNWAVVLVGDGIDSAWAGRAVLPLRLAVATPTITNAPTASCFTEIVPMLFSFCERFGVGHLA